MAPWAAVLFAVSVAATIPPKAPVQPGFTSHNISNIRSRLLESANASWELGVAAEALTELSWPALSVFNASAFPPPIHLNASLNASDVLAIAHSVVSTRPSNSLALIGGQGSAADPASIGVAVLLANWTRTNSSDMSYAKAANDQLTYLLNDVPQTAQGAISHRADQVQLWADFIYMVPPFIAYYGALQTGQVQPGLLQIAYEQCSLYRDALRDPSGLWRHVTLGNWQDSTHWATGNAWAAAGMLRVLQTLNHSSEAHQFVKQQANLTQWIQEIIETSWSHQKDNGTLFNVIDDPNSFADTSSTALLASVTYRMAVINNDTSLIPQADKALKLIENSVDNQGWLQNTVDPYTFSAPTQPGKHSPEGQAFVLLLHSAWRNFQLFSKK